MIVQYHKTLSMIYDNIPLCHLMCFCMRHPRSCPPCFFSNPYISLFNFYLLVYIYIYIENSCQLDDYTMSCIGGLAPAHPIINSCSFTNMLDSYNYTHAAVHIYYTNSNWKVGYMALLTQTSVLQYSAFTDCSGIFKFPPTYGKTFNDDRVQEKYLLNYMLQPT